MSVAERAITVPLAKKCRINLASPDLAGLFRSLMMQMPADLPTSVPILGQQPMPFKVPGFDIKPHHALKNAFPTPRNLPGENLSVLLPLALKSHIVACVIHPGLLPKIRPRADRCPGYRRNS